MSLTHIRKKYGLNVDRGAVIEFVLRGETLRGTIKKVTQYLYVVPHGMDSVVLVHPGSPGIRVVRSAPARIR